MIVSAPNPERLLYPGMTAALKVIVRETGDVLTVPNRALDFRPPRSGEPPLSTGATSAADKAKVWIEGLDGRAVSVEIQTGARDEDRTAVIEGPLSEGQPLIVGMAKPGGQRRFLG